MEEVDANDNGIATHDGKARYAVTTTLASRVANLRPHWNDPDQDFDKGFYKAMALVWPEFEDRVHFYEKVWWPAREIVAKALENRFSVHSSGKIMLLDNGGCPFKVVSMGESAQLAPSSSFYVVTSAILGCKSFKIGGNFWIILLKSYKSKDLTSFLD